jgi:hypothetical protein
MFVLLYGVVDGVVEGLDEGVVAGVGTEILVTDANGTEVPLTSSVGAPLEPIWTSVTVPVIELPAALPVIVFPISPDACSSWTALVIVVIDSICEMIEV